MLVFCEVKTRRAGSGDPWENLGEAKRRQVRSMGARLARRGPRPPAHVASCASTPSAIAHRPRRRARRARPPRKARSDEPRPRHRVRARRRRRPAASGWRPTSALGLPAFTIVGLADKAVREARERVRSAITNSGFEFPQKRITINLAPAYLRKIGPGFDLPLAMAILAASGQVERDAGGGLRVRRRAVADRRAAADPRARWRSRRARARTGSRGSSCRAARGRARRRWSRASRSSP